MLEYSGFYINLCEDGSTGCHAQQVAIAKLWSAIMLSEFTIFPSGVLMDKVGPLLFTIYAGTLHCASTLLVLNMSKNSPYLVIPFFGCGCAAHAAALLAMRTVFIFETAIGRSRWIMMCVSIFDSSAVSTMIYYNLWEAHLISVETVFKLLAVIGMVLFGLLVPLYADFLYCRRRRDESDTLEKPLVDEHTSPIKAERKLSLYEVVSSPVFYFSIIFSAVSIYRIRYFLGIITYTLKRLRDDGFYLKCLGYSFVLSVVFTPAVDWILRSIKCIWSHFHLVNALMTLYFVFWLIPILPVQLITFALFVFVRLMFFVVFNDYVSTKFTEDWFGFVLGLGFVLAAIPGTFTYLIVDIVLSYFQSNFWLFHVICMLMTVPTSIMVCLMKRHDSQNVLSEKFNCNSSDEMVIKKRMIHERE